MQYRDLILEKEGPTLLVKIKRPDVLNALRETAFQELEQVLDEFSGNARA